MRSRSGPRRAARAGAVRSPASPPLRRALVAALVAAVGAPAASAAPPAAPPAARDATPTHAAGVRAPADTILGVRTLTFLTGDTTASAVPRPVLVMLHWADSSPEELRDHLAALPVRARVVLPEGFARTPRGWRWWPRAPVAPATPDAAAEASAAQVLAAAERLAAYLRALRARYPDADGAPLVVGGVSQGGDLSFALAIRHPDVVDAALPVAGRLLPPMLRGAALADAAPIHAFHGAADTIASHEAVADAVARARDAGARIALHSYPGVAHDLPPHELADLRACAVALLERGGAGVAAADCLPDGRARASGSRAPAARAAEPPAVARWTPAAWATPEYESSPTFTPDGREAYFMRADRAFRGYRLLWSRCEAGGWSAPAEVPFAAPAPAQEGDPALSADGNRLYYISTRHAPAAEDFDVWVVDREPGGPWGSPRRLPPPVSSPASELLPRPGPGGTLYFGSSRAGGHGQSDIYVAHRVAPPAGAAGAAGADGEAAGAWAVRNLGPPVSTAANEYEADVSRDGSTLVVVADRGDRSHLYRFARRGDRWVEAHRIDADPNVFQVGPLLSPGADRVLFAQADGDRSGELFVADLRPDADRRWPPRCAP